MSINAGRWNKGLTAETDDRVRVAAIRRQGHRPWNKGLDQGDARIKAAIVKLKTYVGENRPWHNGLKAELTLEDFKPFMDARGNIDRKRITEELGLSWQTIFAYMKTFDLETSDVNVREVAEARTVRLSKEDLEQFCLANGKVSIGRARKATGHSYSVIRRECERHGLPMFNRRIRQTLCLETVAEALGGMEYMQEWMNRSFLNPKTGYPFKFDGYFKDVGLVVEYHGHQHFMFPNAFMTDESYRGEWEAMCERDRLKREMIEGSELMYLEFRYDEPYDDLMYVRGALRALKSLGVSTGFRF